jgi:hypothetical protein
VVARSTRRFPRLGWLGLAVMLAGFGLDLVAHTVLASAAQVGGFSPGQHAAHLVVLVGMVVLLGAVVVDGTRHAATVRPAASPRQKGRTRDALR